MIVPTTLPPAPRAGQRKIRKKAWFRVATALGREGRLGGWTGCGSASANAREFPMVASTRRRMTPMAMPPTAPVFIIWVSPG